MASSYNYRKLALAACCVVLTACSQSDGYIGDFYGKWQLEGSESYLNFQHRICQMQIVNSQRHELTSIWSSFEYTTDSLFIDVRLADYTPGTTDVDGKNTTALLHDYFGLDLPKDGRLRFGYQLSAESLLLSAPDKTLKFRHYGF